MTLRISGVVLVVIGILLILFSDNISAQVAAGRERIARGQEQVDTANSLFSHSQYTKPFGNAFTGSGQERINAGTQQANEYEVIAGKVQIAGYASIVLGIVVFLFSFYRKKLL